MSPMKAVRKTETKKEKLRRALLQKALKPHVVADFITKEKWQLKEIEKQRERLMSRLRAVVPKDISGLFRYYGYDYLFRITEGGRDYDFDRKEMLAITHCSTLEQFKRKLGSLRRAWKGIVEVKLSAVGVAGSDTRIVISFKPI